MGSYPVTQGQGERKHNQEKTQAPRESMCAWAPMPGRQYSGQLAQLRVLGWGSSWPSPTESPDSEDTEAQRQSPGHALKGHLTPCSECVHSPIMYT